MCFPLKNLCTLAIARGRYPRDVIVLRPILQIPVERLDTVPVRRLRAILRDFRVAHQQHLSFGRGGRCGDQYIAAFHGSNIPESFYA